MDMNRKNRLLTILMLGVMLMAGGCHQPDELLPPVSRHGINSITATFEDGTGSFTGYFTEGSQEIVIPIPFFYPESSDNAVTQNQLKKMRVKANLDDNVVVTPALLFMDLTQSNTITVTDQLKKAKQYTVRGEIRKSSECLITEFTIPSLGLSGVINEMPRPSHWWPLRNCRQRWLR